MKKRVLLYFQTLLNFNYITSTIFLLLLELSGYNMNHLRCTEDVIVLIQSSDKLADHVTVKTNKKHLVSKTAAFFFSGRRGREM